MNNTLLDNEYPPSLSFKNCIILGNFIIFSIAIILIPVLMTLILHKFNNIDNTISSLNNELKVNYLISSFNCILNNTLPICL